MDIPFLITEVREQLANIDVKVVTVMLAEFDSNEAVVFTHCSGKRLPLRLPVKVPPGIQEGFTIALQAAINCSLRANPLRLTRDATVLVAFDDPTLPKEMADVCDLDVTGIALVSTTRGWTIEKAEIGAV